MVFLDNDRFDDEQTPTRKLAEANMLNQEVASCQGIL